MVLEIIHHYTASPLPKERLSVTSDVKMIRTASSVTQYISASLGLYFEIRSYSKARLLARLLAIIGESLQSMSRNISIDSDSVASIGKHVDTELEDEEKLDGELMKVGEVE